jgi:hypothetical protein
MNSETEKSKQDIIAETIIYVLFVALLAYLITNQLIGAVLPADRYAGYLLVVTRPAVLVLCGLSFVFYKYFKRQENIVLRYSILVANSLFASVLGVLITYPFVSR